MNTLFVRALADSDVIPPNTYQFGLSTVSLAAITNWQLSNVFANIPDGKYYVAVRRISDSIVVRDWVQYLYSLDIPDAISLKQRIDRAKSRRFLTVTSNAQSTFVIGADEDRTLLLVEGLLAKYGQDYTITLPNLNWISPDFLLKAGMDLELRYDV